jgi:hypothetical protein
VYSSVVRTSTGVLLSDGLVPSLDHTVAELDVRPSKDVGAYNLAKTDRLNLYRSCDSSTSFTTIEPTGNGTQSTLTACLALNSDAKPRLGKSLMLSSFDRSPLTESQGLESAPSSSQSLTPRIDRR